MMHELRMYVFADVRLGLVLGRHPKINLFGLHYCVICCEVETKSLSELMHDVSTASAPIDKCNLFTKTSRVHSYNTRSSTSDNF